MSRLNNANSEQRILIRELMRAANDCPAISEREAFNKFQEEVLEPIRQRIIEAGKEKK